jgi:acetyl-CoA carboxylase, biotin carboxylase subunit
LLGNNKFKKLNEVTMFKKILISNRAEIALRIIRACKEMKIKTVIPYSDIDRDSIPVSLAEESYALNGVTAKDTYLNIDKIIEIAKKANVDAIHPGYGFLSENANFAKACKDNNIVFIGPTYDVLSKIEDKIAAKRIVKKAGLPVIKGVNHSVNSIDRAKKIIKIIGYPVIIKAVNGGGGKGMRVVTEEAMLELALQAAARESINSFNSDKIFIEKFIDNPKHVEVQILADNYGNIVHLFERDCTIQRRHQKLLEEAPSPMLDDKQRSKLGNLAIKACKAMNYTNAGTVEFLLDSKGDFHFMEINARIQVEHPVTELITNIDIVKEQIKIASGKKLNIRQKNIKINGHAIECRINAEDTENNFLPSTGLIEDIIIPGGNGVRVDTAIKNNTIISPYYDSMLAKLIVHSNNRSNAISKMYSALTEMKISGIKTTTSFFRKLFLNKDFINKNYTTKFLETFRIDEAKDGVHFKAAAVLAALYHKKMKQIKSFSDKKPLNKETKNKWGLAGRSEAIRISRGW